MSDSFRSTEQLSESPAVEVTGKIMVVAIVILFMVVAFVLVLHLYAKWFWWRIEEPTPPPPRRRRRRRFVFAPGQDPSINVSHQSGLDPSLLKSLPVLTYQPEDFKEGLECAVCLSEIVEGEKARLLPKCNHGFHVDCIDMWFQSHSTCPICRNPVAPESSKCNNSSSVRENSSENSSQSQAAENSASAAAMNVSESPNFPTNVLIWGNQTQVSSSGTALEEEEGPSSSSAVNSSSSSNNRHHEMLVIDIPSEANSSSLSPSASRFAEDELKSPMTTRLRSLKRLLSRDKRLGPSNPSSLDVEQAGRAQS